MIAFNFVYCKPNTLQEAAEAFETLEREGKSPVYYGGGSEIITMSRAGSISPGGVIDLKAIPECNVLERNEEELTLGGGVSLHAIRESKLFPLLGTAAGRIADHTNQCRITVGGNLCGTIPYREAVLPLLLADAQMILYSSGGPRRVPLHDVFHGRMELQPGEFVCQIKVAGAYLTAPFMHVKKTTNEKIDYPLVNVSALMIDGQLRVAFSGLCPFPFRSREMEGVLNDRTTLGERRVEKAANLLPDPAVTDVEGSGEYRLFVMKNILLQILERAKHDLV